MSGSLTSHESPGSSGDCDVLGAGAERHVSAWSIAIALGLVYVIWGSTYLAIRFAVETMPPLMMAGVRFLCSGVILLALSRRRDKQPLTAAHWKSAGIVGCLLLLGGNGLVCWAETGDRVPSGVAALLVATMPLWMVTLGWLAFGGPRPVVRTWLGLAGGLAGVYLLMAPASGTTLGPGTDLLGGGALLLACGFWATGSLYARRAELPQSSFTTTGMEMLVGGAALGIVGIATGEATGFDVTQVSLRSTFAWLYLVVFGSLLGFTAYIWLLKATTPAVVSTYAYVNPAIAVALGAAAGERLTRRTWLGTAVIRVGCADPA